jgi:hypothetical protein
VPDPLDIAAVGERRQRADLGDPLGIDPRGELPGRGRLAKRVKGT